MKNGEFSGHSIDEAVFHGLMELGLSIDEVTIETLQNETKGLFGIGAKMARVRLTQRPPAEVEAIQAERAGGQERHGGGRRDERRDNRPRSDGRDSRPQGQGGRPPQRKDRREREDYAPAPPTPQYNYSQELAKENQAGQFLSGLLERMQIDAEVLAAETEDGLRLRIDSATKGLLIGRRGETLDALQYLTSLTVNRTRKQDKYLRVTLDTEDYRAKREDTLRKLARRQASRVKASGRSVSMEPMNPYERRVLHASLQGHPYVTTYSEGEEPNRRVIIAPK